MTGSGKAHNETIPADAGERDDAEVRSPSLFPAGQRGIALLLVLWFLVLLSVMVLSFSGTARTQARIARNLHDNAQARWMADAGARLAVRALWLADGRSGQAADGAMRFCSFQSGTLTISIQNVLGLIDLNAAPVSTLENLFVAAGLVDAEAGRLADAVADFRDPDDRPRLNGAEAEAYAAAGLAHGPKNSSFQAVEELEQVLGMPASLLNRIRPTVTVHSSRPSADLRFAPPLVRSAYGETPTAPGATQTAARSTSNGTFAVTVTARTASGAYFVRESVLSVNGPPSPAYTVLRWTQGSGRAISMPVPNDLPPC